MRVFERPESLGHPLFHTEMKNSPPVRHGFTLIELLMVIAVIALVAALLLLGLNAAKSKAKRTLCFNNLRQVNLGLHMYSDDSHDKAPRTPYTTNSSIAIDWTGYKKLMKSYVGLDGSSSSHDKLFACPADTFFYDLLPHGRGYVAGSIHNLSLTDFSSYGFNAGSTTRIATNAGLAGRTFTSIKHPTRTILVAEFSAFCPWSWHQPREPRAQPPWVYSDARNVMSFVDGHISYNKIYWNSAPWPDGTLSLAMQYDPPAHYSYQWSPD